MITYLPPKLDDPERYQDESTGKVYRKIVGGLAWPFKEKPGFMVVLAQDYEPDSGAHHHYWVLGEGEAHDIGTLVRLAGDYRQQYEARTWMANTGNKPAMYLLGELMRQQPYRQQLYLDMAPHADDAQGLSFYLPLIRACISPKKLLHFGESELPGYLTRASNEDLSKNPEEFPPLAALGYALSELYNYIPAMVSNLNTDYGKIDGAWML